MARLVYLRRPKKRRNITRFAPPLITSAVGTITTASNAQGQIGIIGTSVGTSNVIAFDSSMAGTSVGTSQVSGVINAANSIGTSVSTTIVSGLFNVASASGSCSCVTTVYAAPGIIGLSVGTSSIVTGFATVQTQEIANQSDFENRIKSLLPPSWFEYSNASNLAIPIAGMAYGLLWIYVLYLYTISQARISTATGVWLDRISYDFLGNGLPRLSGETDPQYSSRIRAAIKAPKQTRQGITDALDFLTGQEPSIIELWNPGDVGCYNTTASNGIATQGYGAAGMYGSLSFRNQILVQAYRPNGEGFPNIPGYGNVSWGYGATDGGEYCDLNNIVAQVKDSDIYANIASTVAAGITAWTVILTKPDVIDAPTAYFGNISNSANIAILGTGFFF